MRKKRRGKREKLLERYLRFLEFRFGGTAESGIKRIKSGIWGLRWPRGRRGYCAWYRFSSKIMAFPYATEAFGRTKSEAFGNLLLKIAGPEKSLEEIELELESGGF